MSQQNVIGGDLTVTGTVSCDNFIPPNECIDNDAIATDAAIEQQKLEGEYGQTLSQTGAVVAATQYLRAIRGATARVLQIAAAVTETIATGGDRTVTIDLLKSTSGGAFASILSATIVLNNASTLRTVVTATIAAGGLNLVAGDILKLTVAVAGAAGAQAAGLVVTVTIAEGPS